MSDGAQTLKAFYQRAVRLALLLLALGAAALYFGLPDGRAAAVGLLAGGAVSILRYRLRLGALLKLRGAGPLVRLRLLTYGLNGAVLAAAFALPHVLWPWSTVAGLLAMNVSLIAAELLPPGTLGGGHHLRAESR
ncbi:MAG: hypothetical protein ACYS8K_00580 [Planctomycetota bacterium]